MHLWLGWGAGPQGQQLRAMLGLMRWLQLYILADPAATQPDVAVDLEGVFKGAFSKGKPAAGGSQSSNPVACFQEALFCCCCIEVVL